MGAESARFIEAYYDNLDVEGNVLSTDRGLFQINSLHTTLPDEDAFKAIPNARYAFQLSKEGTDFTPWAVWNSKSYLRYLPQVLWFFVNGRAWRRRIPHIPELLGERSMSPDERDHDHSENGTYVSIDHGSVQRGHSEAHICSCGEIAIEGRTLFGEDVPGDLDYEPPSELLGEEP